MRITTTNSKLIIAAALAVAAIAHVAGFPLLSPETVAGLSLLMIGDVEGVGAELKSLLTKQGEAFEAFKKLNDERLKALESKGYAPADVVEKVEKANADLNEIAKAMKQLEAKSNRPGAGGDGPQLTEAQQQHKTAFGEYLRKGREGDLAALQVKAMNTGSDPDGGYLVYPEMDMAIDRFAPIVSSMYRLADIRTISTNRWQKNVKTSGMAMRRVAEGSTGGESTAPKYSRIEVEVFPAEVEPWVFNETLEDAAINLEADLAEEAGIAFAEGAGSEFINGDGVGKARGILKYPIVANASYAWGSIGYIASGGAGDFAASNPADKLIDLAHALKQQYRGNAAWLMSDTTLSKVRQIKDGTGNYYLWQPDPAGPFGGRLLGHPVEVDDNMPAIAANSYSIAFGDFKRGFVIVNRTGTQLIRDNITAKGTTKFNFRRRFGGGVKHFEAIKLMKFAAS